MKLRAVLSILLMMTGMSFAKNALSANKATVDVLVLYTPGVVTRYGGNQDTRINHLFSVANQVYVDSRVDLELRVVHTAQVNYPDTGDSSTALRDMTYKRNSAFANVDQLREQYGADMVLLYRPYSSSHNSCGVAWIGGYKSNGNFSHSYYKSIAYSHVSISTCGDYVTAHEIGHNMGLLHSRLQNGEGGTLPHALGHGVHNQFTTVMAYQSAFNVNYWTGKVYKFSSPNLDCRGFPCGVSTSDTVNSADAASVLNLTGPQIADFFPTKVNGNNNQNLIDELAALMNDARSDYNTAHRNYIDQRKNYVNQARSRKQALKTFRTQIRNFKKARSRYVASYRQYRKYRNLAKRSSRYKRAFYNAARQLRKARGVYISARSTYSNSYRTYRAQHTEFMTARTAFIDARKARSSAYSNYISARNTYRKALNA